MIIIPAIDVINGGAVRLLQGDFAKVTQFEQTPSDIARSYAESGAEWLHLVDLDGARHGTTPSFKVFAEIIHNSGLHCQIGGGIRDRETAVRYIELGAKRIVLGTAAILNPDFALELTHEYGDKIAVGIDILNGRASITGWSEQRGDAVELINFFARNGVSTLIVTDITKDGAESGTNLALYRELSTIAGVNIIASGGVSSLHDISKLASFDIYGAIVGKALLAGTMTLRDAISAAAFGDTYDN